MRRVFYCITNVALFAYLVVGAFYLVGQFVNYEAEMPKILDFVENTLNIPEITPWWLLIAGVSTLLMMFCHEDKKEYIKGHLCLFAFAGILTAVIYI